MKNKFILAVAILTIGLAGFLFGRQWLNKPKLEHIERFLETFSADLQSKPADSVLIYFDVQQPKKEVIRMINLLAGRTAVSGKKKPLFSTLLDILSAEITTVNESRSNIKIPITLRNPKLPDFTSSFDMELLKLNDSTYRITSFNGESLFTDFIAYENAIKMKMHTEDEIFDLKTLAAFKVAEQLKSKYDSVIWFSYVDEKPFYYVALGEWDISKLYSWSKDKTGYQIGLLNAELKEIIPPKYDVIHNISGTFEGLIEVEKDNKRGFYNLEGENVIPIIHDQIYPLNDSTNIAVLAIGGDYFWLRKDYSISEKDSSINISDVLNKVTAFQKSNTFSGEQVKHLIEYNSKEYHAAIYLPPSHLTDWKLLNNVEQFKNPMRKKVEYYDISSSVDVAYNKTNSPASWLQAAFYSIRDNYIGGRSDFYDSRNLLMVDRRSNRVYSYRIDYEFGLSEHCGEFSFNSLSDSLFEIKSAERTEAEIEKETYITDMPVYHYMIITNGMLNPLPNQRAFAFTKYVKIDDSYLKGCYIYDQKETSSLPKAALIYMKNEIYAEYGYDFKDEEWNERFKRNITDYEPKQPNVDKYLSPIDKYNINWINQKLAVMDSKQLASVR